MSYWVLAYYHIGEIADPHLEVERHKEFFQGRDMRGRIYFSEQGINGQASASREAAQAYIAWMRGDPRFQSVDFKIHSFQEHAFPKMTVKYRRQLVAIDCDVDLSIRGESLSPADWKKMLQERGEETLLLDVRNDYEWKIGHFEGAELPSLEAFRQFPLYARQLRETEDPKTTPVMMYCTGGIRCEFFSAVLRQEGFEKVYQLAGGVIGYGLQEGSDSWEGNLFVFDDRLVVPVGEMRARPISPCKHCQTACDVYYNCAHIACNALFLSCQKCLKEHRGCCSEACASSKKLRAYQESAKPFRKWNAAEKRAWRAVTL